MYFGDTIKFQHFATVQIKFSHGKIIHNFKIREP